MKVGKITDELIERIIQENDLREVATEYGVEIDDTGKASCPFHNDGKNGNLHFFSKKDEAPSYFCFSRKCNAGKKWENKEKKDPHILKLPNGQKIEDGGPNVIGFVMNIEACSFIEACVILMNRAGIPIPEAHVNPRMEKEKKRVTKLNKLYYGTLKKDKEMLEYLTEKRGITRESISKWRLGVVPKGHKHPDFGTLIEGRLVFGMVEESWDPKHAHTIAMAYRTMKDEKPKYFNDHGSEIYDKKNYLYGLSFARKAIRRMGYAIVMEGYTDTIISHQVGIENTVSTCGTAFTDEQQDKLRALTNKIIFWYDGDSAGFDAMMETVDELIAKGFRVFIIDSTPHDPAEVMLTLGQDKDRVEKFIAENAKPALQVLADLTLNRFDSKISALKTDALDELLPIMNLITDESEKIVFKSMINHRLGVAL